MKNKLAFHGHVEEAYLRHMEKKMKDKRAAMGINPCIRDLYLKIESGEAKNGAPISPVLSPYGLNVVDFVNQFNKKSITIYNTSVKIPVIVNVYENKATKFKLTSAYTFYIISGNNNKYKIYKILDIYKRFLIINESIKRSELRVWSTIDELYKKPNEMDLSLINASTRKKAKKRKNINQKKNYIITEQNRLKTILGTIMGTKSIIYLKLKHYYQAQLINLQLSNNHEKLINKMQWLVLNNNKISNRLIKLKKKTTRKINQWLYHKNIYYKQCVNLKN